MSAKLWGGRFTEQTSSEVDRFNASISFDYKLWSYDIQGSIAHVRMLASQKIISPKEASQIEKGLRAIAKEIDEGEFEWRLDQEDVHLNIEAALIQKIGPVGGKLHSARSRNDQVALDLRLYAQEHLQKLQQQIAKFQQILLQKAKTHLAAILPGYTHLQRAQPILLSHHLLAYFEMLERDQERLDDLRKRVETLPLGSGALAGTPLPIDRKKVAQELGFARISANSLDAVSDRDFVVELLSSCSLVMVHLSRFAEELILWSTLEFQFAELPQNYCTGSSMMPQKMNPDVLELIRGKTGRVFGNLSGLLTTLKALPLAYNKDLQEDKEPLFDSVETTLNCLELFAGLLKGVRFRKDRMLKATEEGFLIATDLADYLVQKGVPFREAHHIVGRIVRLCQEQQASIESLPLSTLREFSDKIQDDVSGWLSNASAINRRTSYGGTATQQVQKQLKRAERILKARDRS